MKIVEQKGSYYEIGYGWGEAFKGKMDQVIQIELGMIAAFYGISIEEVEKLGIKYLSAAELYDPDFVGVLRGFAGGAEIDFDTLFAIRSALEILFFTGQPTGLCTSLAITGKATKDGEAIIGQNIDWHPDLPVSVLKIEWPTGVKQLSLSLGGIFEYSLSAHPASSPYGIAATLTATPDKTPEIPKVPISIVMNKASRQNDIKKAVSVFSKANVNLACFLLANGEGDIHGIELGLESFEKLKPEMDILIHANHYNSDRYKAQDIFLQYVPDSPLRYQRLTELVKQDLGSITPDLVMSYLKDHANHPKGICAHVDPKSDMPPSATMASVIMVPSQKIMYVAVGNPCQNDYQRYDLD